MSVWSVPAFLDALEDALNARDAFAGVTVETAHPGGDRPKNPSLIIVGVTGAGEEGTFGPNNDEEYIAEGLIFSQYKGPGREKWKAARDRANGLLYDLGAYLQANPTVEATCGYARPGGFDFVQGANANGRWCLISFDIKVTALS